MKNKKQLKSESIPEFSESINSLSQERKDYIDNAMEGNHKGEGYLYWVKLIIIAILFFLIGNLIITLLPSCATVPKTHYTTVRITQVKEVDKGYWVYFRDRNGLYKTFQETKPDSLYPGKVLNMPKVYKINRGL